MTTVGTEASDSSPDYGDALVARLRASQRRGRAILEAVPDKMFRISETGIILDLRDNPGMSMPPATVGVGSSVYEASVPRKVIDRVMEGRRRALATGVRQAAEFEVELAGESKYLEGRFVPSGENEFLAVIRDVSDRRQEAERAALHRVALEVASETTTERIFDLVAAEVGGVLQAHAGSCATSRAAPTQ